MTDRKVAVVAGVGPGNGLSLATRFAHGDHAVALLAREEAHAAAHAEGLANARGYACDVADAAAVARTFARIADELGPVDVLLFNAGPGVFADVETVTPAAFEEAWRVNALGGFLCARAVIPAMKARGRGAIVFVGATASRRGAARTAAFAPAKAAQRSLAQSMAKSLGPSGIHVALIVVDGVVDTPATRRAMPDAADTFFVDPDGVAEIAWHLAHQQRQAWTFEMEARPWKESW